MNFIIALYLWALSAAGMQSTLCDHPRVELNHEACPTEDVAPPPPENNGPGFEIAGFISNGF